MKKRLSVKLTLSRETLRQLNPQGTEQVAGGASTNCQSTLVNRTWQCGTDPCGDTWCATVCPCI
jgi:hypothetical protein